jgi:ABC-type transport system involved in multi-copper enzyme maturation permease subunit
LRATARSEWIKFRSVRSGPAVLLATAVILPVTAWLLCAYYRNSWATMSPASKASFDPVFISLRGIEGAQLFVGALGVITATGEYTSGLIRSTFIATPQRAQVIALKAMIFAAVVWAWCTLLSFAAFFIGQALLSSPANHVVIGDPGVLTAVFGGGLYLTAVGLLGLFIGVLLRRTPGALAALFGILLVVPVAVGLSVATSVRSWPSSCRTVAVRRSSSCCTVARTRSAPGRASPYSPATWQPQQQQRSCSSEGGTHDV